MPNGNVSGNTGLPGNAGLEHMPSTHLCSQLRDEVVNWPEVCLMALFVRSLPVAGLRVVGAGSPRIASRLGMWKTRLGEWSMLQSSILRNISGT